MERSRDRPECSFAYRSDRFAASVAEHRPEPEDLSQNADAIDPSVAEWQADQRQSRAPSKGEERLDPPAVSPPNRRIGLSSTPGTTASRTTSPRTTTAVAALANSIRTRPLAWGLAAVVAVGAIVGIAVAASGGGGSVPGANVSPIRLQDALASAQPRTSDGYNPIYWSCSSSATCQASLPDFTNAPFSYSVSWDTNNCFTANVTTSNNGFGLTPDNSGLPRVVQGCV